MKVLQFPLAKITASFTAGILFAFYLKPNNTPVFVCVAVSFIALFAAWFFARRDWIQKIYFGLAVYGVGFLLGTATWIVHSGTFQSDGYIHRLDGMQTQHYLEITLRERQKNATSHHRFIANVDRINGKRCSGKILVNLRRDGFADKHKFAIGSRLSVHGSILKHQPPKNPDQFDYGAYLVNKSVMAQLYVRMDQVKLGAHPTKDIFYYSDKIRNTIVHNLQKSGLEKQELAVLAALILGQQHDIDPELLRDYQLAGAVHILSVSGLHVGFILMFMNFLLGYIPKTRSTRKLKLAVILISLWGFAVLAGLSPSVIRSVTMFSFVAVGMHLKRKTNIYHTLLVSMLLILIFEPAFLFDVGFQLSYLALFFILWLQPLLSDAWQPKNKVVMYFWQILTVSFAAQLGTLPLSIYYFHQFPGLFFVTNLVVIPLLSIIMALGIAAMLPAVLGNVPLGLIKILESSVALLNQIIARIASFEQFIFDNISMNRQMMLCLYLLIITAVIALRKSTFGNTAALLCSVVVFQSVCLIAQIENRRKKEWIVFNAPKSTVIAQRTGEQITAYGDFTFDKMLQGYATANFCTITARDSLQNTAFFNGSKIMIVDSTSVYPNVKPDILLMRQSPKINLERLLQSASPNIVVADASNYKSYIKLWKATCKKYKIPFHATAEMGYFKL